MATSTGTWTATANLADAAGRERRMPVTNRENEMVVDWSTVLAGRILRHEVKLLRLDLSPDIGRCLPAWSPGPVVRQWARDGRFDGRPDGRQARTQQHEP